MLQEWDQGEEISIWDEFLKSRYVSFLSGDVGVHKVASVEQLFCIDFFALPTNEPS